MIKMKKILAGFTALTMLCGIACMNNPIISEMVNTVSVSAETLTLENGLEYEIWGKTIEITGCDKSVTEIEIPAEIDGLPVTDIRNEAFKDCISLTSVTIPDSVIFIHSGAFENCTSLTSVTIPDSVIDIGYKAFKDCTSLNSVTIPDSVTSIGDSAFRGTSLTEVIIPDSVTSIDSLAFYSCTSLTSVIIPDSVTYMGSSAFVGTPFLENQTTDIKYAGKWAVDCNKDVTEVEIKLGTVGIAGAFDDCRLLTSVTIPDSVKYIGDFAFSGCTLLPSVTIPDSVTYIGKCAFQGCHALTSIEIPDSVTYIDDDAFNVCQNLEAINVDLNNKNYSSENGVLFNKDKTEIVTYPDGKTGDTYKIPDSVASIGSKAFSSCASLIEITIPNFVTSIGYEAFAICESLTEVKIPDSVTSVGYKAFSGCESLTSVTIPDSVTNIDNYAFGYYFNSKKIEDFTIYGVKGTAAETYAIENEFNFVEIESESAEISGDLDGDGETTSSDALNLLQAVVGSADLTDEQKKLADLNGDGEITSADALIILQMVVGMR